MVNMKRRVKEHFFSRGITEKGFLLLITSLVFFLFVSIGLITILFNGHLDPMYIELLAMTSFPFMTVTTGIMGVQAVETIANRKTKVELESAVEKRIQDPNQCSIIADEILIELDDNSTIV